MYIAIIAKWNMIFKSYMKKIFIGCFIAIVLIPSVLITYKALTTGFEEVEAIQIPKSIIESCSKNEISKNFASSTVIKYNKGYEKFTAQEQGYFSFSGNITTVNVFGRELDQSFLCRTKVVESQCENTACLYY